MVSNPYAYPPRKIYLSRMLGPATGLFLLGFLASGFLVMSPGIGAAPQRKPAAVGVQPVPLEGAPWFTAAQHMQNVLNQWSNVPNVCWPWEEPPNPLVAQECSRFWYLLLVDTAAAALPFALVTFFLLVAMDLLSVVYRRAQKVVNKGNVFFTGIVTNPAELKGDFFGWMFCLRSISVQLPNQKKYARIYIPLSSRFPAPGFLWPSSILAKFSVEPASSE